MPQSGITTDIVLSPGARNSLSFPFDHKVHCVAAEPYATFLRVGVADRGNEVFYEVLVLGRLRRGYRVLRLRSLFGTRVELAHVFVRLDVTSESHAWPTTKQLRTDAFRKDREHHKLKQELEQLRSNLARQQSGAALCSSGEP